eukprot:CAMPEP_0113323842 /NCGR_PEP_ID=MMETSP0010_2-20120614/16604_1 /TAXON_ID=216773 ORGANISM="Corethron hystrix, Strain 308" /NCGR_SAMPLE_ID=MMETSP0010_2 /ASSEMBLY_ACC=CAM_ASM_000155 /LENGTH=340 /DNA_ID=CAMNT_0000182935 /DNA_START=418 /DNA_END=1436 /DNA_ORIENTATION=+ /assembly_acc=CAM_ASM_000155
MDLSRKPEIRKRFSYGARIPDGGGWAVITRKGRGGRPKPNQDRAVIVSPFAISGEEEEKKEEEEEETSPDSYDDFLLGIFDGHDVGGERVAELVTTRLPETLARYILHLRGVGRENPAYTVEKDDISSALSSSFVELDGETPEVVGPDGGSTASVVYRRGDLIFFANTGDSTAFAALYDPSTTLSNVIFETRPHKLSDTEERRRVKKKGGEIWDPRESSLDREGVSARVVLYVERRGEEVRIAMTRSIGDYEMRRAGVIPDPDVDILDIREVGQLDRHLFVVAGSDGVFDFLDKEEIAYEIGKGLFEPEDHPILACERLLEKVRLKISGNYRDDATIAVR